MLWRILPVLALNLIPAWGVWRWDWSLGTLLWLYAVENFLGALLMWAAIWLYQRRRPAGATLRLPNTGESGNANEYVGSSIIAAGITSVFVCIMPAIALQDRPEAVGQWEVDPGMFALGVVWAVAMLLVDFFVMLPGILRGEHRPLEQQARARMGRIIALAANVIIGVIVARHYGVWGMLVAMLALKTLADVVATFNVDAAPAR